MRKYNSGEQTITIPLVEFQSLTLADKVLTAMRSHGNITDEDIAETQQFVKEQDEVGT